jgi:hypothetical protein
MTSCTGSLCPSRMDTVEGVYVDDRFVVSRISRKELRNPTGRDAEIIRRFAPSLRELRSTEVRREGTWLSQGPARVCH